VRSVAARESRPRWLCGSRGLLVGIGLLSMTFEPGRAQGAPNPPAADVVRDTFPHRRHVTVACLVCHLSRTGERLTFQPPRGCQICHHQVESRGGCVQCHQQTRLADTLAARLVVQVEPHAPRSRPVAFPHQRHTDLDCEACHTGSVSMAPVDSAAGCTGCHEQHHEPNRACAVCHRTESVTPAHARPVRPHVACDACHASAAIARLSPTRSFCLACHEPAVDHHPARECVACHLQLEPDEYRSRLRKPRPAR
jgi:hypothetical protein